MARNFATKEGAKVQEYCMYFKLLQRTFGGKVPPDAADAFNQCFLRGSLRKVFVTFAHLVLSPFSPQFSRSQNRRAV
ncbi:MAG: hypothetical protein LUD69_09210 [Oscillospiraceae bacterium]|nr:hypothetical protein [Oscillospiraceae bacterium]